MPDNRIPLVTNEFYHIYNRGVARNPIFLSQSDYEQAILALSYYIYSNPPIKLSRLKELSQEQRNQVVQSIIDTDKLVEVVSFVFIPNHFHFLLKQSTDKGIAAFISKFSNSYTRYFNTKHDRVGSMFQGVFKAVHIETDEQLIHLSRYIHLNPVASFVIHEKNLFTYPWSSLPAYLNGELSFIDTKEVLSNFSSKEEYKQFVINQADYAKELKKIKYLTLENTR